MNALRQTFLRALALGARFGFDLRRFARTVRGLTPYWRDYRALRTQLAAAPQAFALKLNPMLEDRFEQSGTASGHYFHQDLLVASRIFHNAPRKHADVGSRVDGFVAHVAAFRAIEVFDVRPLDNTIPNITFKVADITAEAFPLHDYCDSLSCLHVIEHLGLGRYGDQVDVNGHLKGLHNLHRLLAPGGTLYLSTPMGPPRIEFNAQRVFALQALLDWLTPHFHVAQFSYVDDAGALHPNVPLDPTAIAQNYQCNYGCAIFELVKLS